MPTLHLGVEDVAYSDPDAPGAVTTGEVAEILEKKYHVMEVFFELYQKKIADELGESIAERLEAMMQGAPAQAIDSISVDALSLMFGRYLSSGEWEQVSGQRIAAAHAGVSHRKKDKKRAGSRVAFVDTGLYRKSFRAWLGRS